MEYLPKLTIISMLLNIGLLELMHFYDMHLLLTIFTVLQMYRGTRLTELYNDIGLYRHMVGILWDVKTLRSYISKTIHPIAMKLTGVT